MDFDLACEIRVKTAKRGDFYGTGYPIAPNRIITAAHVVADAKSHKSHASSGDSRYITLDFVVKGIVVSRPVYIEWSGAEAGVDVAVLRCELPAAVQPTHKLLTEPPGTEIEWLAQGYTDFGKERRPHGKDDWHGKVTAFTKSNNLVALECSSGPIDSRKWAGGSGSLAFDSKTRAAFAVITQHEEEGKTLEHLMAVPLCYLLNSETTRDGFSRAIQFETYRQRKAHYDTVMSVVVENLEALGRDSELLKRIAKEIQQLVGEHASGITLSSDTKTLAQQVAVCLVDHQAVSDVSRYLVRLQKRMKAEDSDNIKAIINSLVPLNYEPQAIHCLTGQIAEGRFKLVAGEVATRTAAEIIMAGYDQQPAKFRGFIDDDLCGHVALNYLEGPVVGPGETPAVSLGVLRAARSCLIDLMALYNRTFFRLTHRLPANGDDEAIIRSDIEDYAEKLNTKLETRRGLEDRTIYCVLKLPPDSYKRAFCLDVLREVSRYVPELIFVELASLRSQREFQMQELMMEVHAHLLPL